MYDVLNAVKVIRAKATDQIIVATILLGLWVRRMEVCGVEPVLIQYCRTISTLIRLKIGRCGSRCPGGETGMGGPSFQAKLVSVT